MLICISPSHLHQHPFKVQRIIGAISPKGNWIQRLSSFPKVKPFNLNPCSLTPKSTLWPLCCCHGENLNHIKLGSFSGSSCSVSKSLGIKTPFIFLQQKHLSLSRSNQPPQTWELMMIARPPAVPPTTRKGNSTDCGERTECKSRLQHALAMVWTRGWTSLILFSHW